MADVKLVEAREAFDVALPGGRPFGVRPGDVFESSDPVVQGREHLFGEVRVRSSQLGPIAQATSRATETATAAPGTKRTVSKPADKTAEKEGKADA